MRPLRDLGLTYEAACHGMQTGVVIHMQKEFPHLSPELRDALKHLRVGIDCRAADQGALVDLLIEAGVFTSEQYIERIRLAANEEVAIYEAEISELLGKPIALR